MDLRHSSLASCSSGAPRSLIIGTLAVLALGSSQKALGIHYDYFGPASHMIAAC
jgi:hypothetical protein